MTGASQRKRSQRDRLRTGRRLRISAARLMIAILLVAAGGWLILTRSLPFAIAESNMETALWLSPNHPAPQLVRARQLRDELLRSVATRETAAASSSNEGGSASGETNTEEIPQGDRDQLKLQIAELARRVLSVEPLNAEAYRLLGEVATDPKEVRDYMKKSVARSRRESVAVYWLMNDSLAQGDIEGTIDYADVLLRSRPQLASYVVGYLAHIAEGSPTGLEKVVGRLSSDPPWRANVLRRLPRFVRDPQTPLRIIKALEARNSSVAPEDSRPYLQHLIGKKRIPLAYATWLQLQTPEQLKSIALLNNGSFDRDIRKGPFGWQVGRSQNALVAFEPHSSRLGGRAMRVVFGSGRVKFSGPRQMVVLGPGSYHLSGEFIGSLEAKRGLKWSVRCAAGRSLGASEMINGRHAAWSKFSFSFNVPSDPKCSGQLVQLKHTSRSASEQFVSGEIWFDNIQIARNQDDRTTR